MLGGEGKSAFCCEKIVPATPWRDLVRSMYELAAVSGTDWFFSFLVDCWASLLLRAAPIDFLKDVVTGVIGK